MQKHRVHQEGLSFSVMLPESMAEFEAVIAASYGRCPISGHKLSGSLSRICPVMAGVARLLGIELFALPALCCCLYKEAADKVEENALRLVV